MAFHVNTPGNSTQLRAFEGTGSPVFLSATAALPSSEELPANLPTQVGLTAEDKRICCYITT